MLAVVRHEKILELLQREQSVKVSELSERLGVTEKTIREDLEKLEAKGLLTRTHGGAVLPSDEGDAMLPLVIPNRKHAEEKQQIARIAVSMVEEGDIVALDGGSTTLAIAKLLPNTELTVITNDLYIIAELIAKERIRLVVPGGHRHHNLLVGAEAAAFLRGLNVKKAFVSATAIHPEHGLSIFTSLLVEAKRALVACAEEVYAVADHSKFDKSALITFAKLDELRGIITDRGCGEETAARYRALGIQLIR